MASVRDDDVVGQVYVHGLGGFPHEFRQPLVVVAGVRVAGGMVVDKGYLCGALQQGFAQDAAYVGGGLVDAAAADAYLVYHFGGVVHKQYPEFFCGKVAEQGMEQLVDVGGRADGGTSGAFLQLAAFAQFQGCHDGDAFGGAHAFESGEVPHLPFAQAVEVVAAGGEYALHQCHGGFFRIAGADEDG